MSSGPIQHNPSAVAPTFVNITPSERGDATNMPYMIVDPSNPMGAVQGAGTVNVDYTWGGVSDSPLFWNEPRYYR